MNELDLTSSQWLRLLEGGEIEILGRMPWSSNATFLVRLTLDDIEGQAIYKPGPGERPLRDFPGGLYRREVAAYELSILTELAVVPETIIREDAPLGEGSLQRFIDADFSQHYFTLFEKGGHEDALRVLAGFDLLANNADRKGGHVLIDGKGHLWGIDHGLCFHSYDKLRTVMWDFAGEQLPPSVVGSIVKVTQGIPIEIRNLLAPDEANALLERALYYLERPVFPFPDPEHRSHPWPLV